MNHFRFKMLIIFYTSTFRKVVRSKKEKGISRDNAVTWTTYERKRVFLKRTLTSIVVKKKNNPKTTGCLINLFYAALSGFWPPHVQELFLREFLHI